MTSLFGQRILILVPHPDDEVVACSAAIGRAQAEGAVIHAAYLTHGCVARSALWPWQRAAHAKRVMRRHEEARRVAEKLGIIPVFWSRRPARFLWRQLPQVRDDILAVIEKHHIDQLWVPAYEGGNADHDGLNALGAHFSAIVTVLEFAEYNWMHGRNNSQRFPYPNDATVSFNLTPEERALKAACLALYASEKRNLNYVETERESFRPITEYDYARPPHPGLLWYMRFQWVPFRHPGVDRTRQAQVSRAIQAFQNDTGTSQR